MSALTDVRPTTTSHSASFLPVVGSEIITPLVTGASRRYVNLDYAASAPSLASVSEHVAEILPFYASVHRGAGYASQVSTSVYENARVAVREFFNARPDDAVIFTRNTTDSINLLAQCLPPGTEVLYLDIEHHANLLPWQVQAHRSVLAAGSVAETVDLIERELSLGHVGLVALTGASNVTGEVLPVARIASLAHRYGARIFVDAAQLAPHRRVDIASADIDYLAFSGHKLYAPFGSGALVGRTDWLDQGEPYLAGGGAVAEVRLESVKWASSPARHEAGSPNVLGAAAIARAVASLAAVDQQAWQAHERELRELAVAGLRDIPGVHVHRLFSDSETYPDSGSIGVVNFSVTGYDAGLAAAVLSAEYGVGVRDGKFCAHPLLRRLGLPTGSLRASFGVGSRLDDVQALIEAVRALVELGPQVDYVIEAGRWVPALETRPFPQWAPQTPGTAGASPCVDEPTAL